MASDSSDILDCLKTDLRSIQRILSHNGRVRSQTGVRFEGNESDSRQHGDLVQINELEIGSNTYNSQIVLYFGAQIFAEVGRKKSKRDPLFMSVSPELRTLRPFKLRLENNYTVNSFNMFSFEYDIAQEEPTRRALGYSPFTLAHSEISLKLRKCKGGFSPEFPTARRTIHLGDYIDANRATLAGKSYSFSHPIDAARFMAHFDRLADDEFWDRLV